MTERIVSSGNVELWSEDFGDPSDSPLLLVAGDTTSALGWPDEFVELLVAGGHHVIRYDHRDTGRSTCRDFSQYPYTFDDLASDAVAVLNGWDVDAAHLVGIGMGSAIGQLVAAAHPERLLSMTLLGAHALDVDFFGNWVRARSGEPTPDGLPTPRRWFVELAEQPVLRDRESELDNRVTVARAMSGNELPFDAAEFRRWEERAIDHAGGLDERELHPHAHITQDLTERGRELARMTTPTLVVQAPLDPISPPPHGRHLAESIPGARLTEIPGMGHALPSAVHQSLSQQILAHTQQFP
jgi:pimeloyl-ACP methyl ester carboxylesterase